MGPNKIVSFVPAAGSGYKVAALAGRHSDGHNPYAVPKFRLTTAGVPIVYTTLRNLQKAGVRDVSITHSLSPSADSLKAYVRSHPRFENMSVEFTLERSLRGTAVSVAEILAEKYPHVTGGDLVVVYYGDILSDLDLGKMIHSHRDSGAAATVAVNLVALDHSHKYGQVVIEGSPGRFEGEDDDHFGRRFAIQAADEGGEMRRITDFVPKDREERPGAIAVRSLFTDSSIYIFRASVIQEWARDAMAQDRLNGNKQIDTGLFSYIFRRRDLFENFYAYVIPVQNYWKDLGTYSDIWLATMDALDQVFPLPFKIPEIASRAWVHPDARIAGSAVLIPPVVVEEGAVIGDHTRIGPYVHVGPLWAVESHVHLQGVGLLAPTAYFEGDRARTVGEYARIVRSLIAGGTVPAHSFFDNRVGHIYRPNLKDESNQWFHHIPMGADPDLAAGRIGLNSSGPRTGYFSVESPKELLK